MTHASTTPQPSQHRGYDFSGSGIVIAGGTSGVGLATARYFANAGAEKQVLVGRNEQRGKEALASLAETNPECDALFVAADVNEVGAADDVVRQAHEHMGRVDVLVNSTVAQYQPTLLHDIPADKLVDILVQQAVGPILMSRAVVPVMREQRVGAIVTIASDAAKVPTPGETGIGAAMAAIVTFSQTLAVEAKRYGVRVNVLTPSLIVNTGSYDRAMSAEFSRKIFDKIVSQAQLGLTEPEDLADAILFLASPLSRRITGQVISVNGGISVV
ncbi:SDR family NAD(P)-dependent oxidoreductase [Rhodococcoides kyotonense]|uniref:NAD(P)-dependent dehydrogenase, short-chain alcohol dehydrogenase family n=1 Tax=Rhodococcoides kyotonense TaxID=398843 RepID=A0A239JYS4_9NOCA|nr:SDR family oxidoreductase [Rhodococcus kyotonensis]SNT10971.1 NAD(P)-dependent dehydrogenase, short-chain alcohol dehydrogenase family [Rhodococcus kyotonensis]